MALPTNILQQVRTYNDAKIGALLNQNCFIPTLNTMFKDYEVAKNLGDTVDIELPNRAMSGDGLVVSFAPVNQTFQPLKVDQAAYSANAFTAQQFMFNAEQYMQKFGLARVMELGAKVEKNVARNATSSVPVMTVNSQGESVPTGALHTESGPFRFFGDGVTAINSFQQLARMEALFRNYGAARGTLKVYLDDISPVEIVGTGLTQFTLERNNELANSWDLGTYKGSDARYYKSNFLPIHYAGNAGNEADTLTLVSTNDPTGVAVTQLTFSGISTNVGAFKSGDLLQFDLDTGLVYLTYVGHSPSRNLVQVRVTADADGTTGTATVAITPTLSWQPGLNQNLNKPLVAGMTAAALPDHRAGLVVGGDCFFLAMPALPDLRPYDTNTSTDKETGVSLRNYFGSGFGNNQTGYVDDCIWATTLWPESCMRLVMPI
jgi:hypothetical protein